MYLKWGGFWFPKNGAQVKIGVKIKRNARNIVELSTQRWDIEYVILDSTQAALIADLVSLESQFRTENKDLTLYLDDQSTIMHQLPTGSALGGTRVVSGPEYPKGDGAEGSTYRTAVLAVEADYPNTGNNILDWEDELEIEGNGGPINVFLETLEGQPQQQVTNQRSIYRARQSGFSLGMFDYAGVAPPIFPNALQGNQTRIKTKTPKRSGSAKRDFLTTWSYAFESTTPLNGVPTSV